MKVALITPWPPQQSGIADYAYQLAARLVGSGVETTVITTAGSATLLANCEIRECIDASDAAVPADALPVFQLGNNLAFHGFQPELLARLGGVVHLHDPVLHHLHVDRTLARREGSYWDDLHQWYGPAVVAAVRRMVERGAPPWTHAAVMDLPFFEPYLRHADAAIVHSQYAAARIRDRMPGLRVHSVAQSYSIAIAPPHAARSGPLTLGIFGWVEPHKRIDMVLRAIAILRDRGVALELEICGHAGAASADTANLIRALGLNGVVHMRGHMEAAAFVAAIARVDLCVNLRDPTMGETSAVVTQALQLGTPVIVSDVGWYAELPECVLKIPAADGAIDALVAHLARLATDRGEVAALARATRHYAQQMLDPDRVATRYVAVLAEEAAERDRRRAIEGALYAQLAAALADLDLRHSPQQRDIQAEILRTLAPCL
ncbi:MAG: glycosyltransferase [Burkholderiaceae bacterium]